MDTRDYNELPVMEDLKCRRGDDICRPISLTINGGYRGMEGRKKYYALAQQVLVR